MHLNTICVPGSGGNRGVQQGGRQVTSSRQEGERAGPRSGGGTSGGPSSRSTGGNLGGGSCGVSTGGGAGGGSSSESKGGIRRGGSGGRSRGGSGGGSRGNGSGGGSRGNGGSRGRLRGNGSTGGSSLENSIFDATKNDGRGNNDGARSESRISYGGFKGSQNGSKRKNVERQNSKGNSIKELKNGSIKKKMKNEKSSIKRILNNNNKGSEDNSSSNDRINPYKDYVNTAGNSFKLVFKLIYDDLYRLPNVLEQPKLPQISFLLLEPILKIK